MNAPDPDAQDAQDMARLAQGHEAALNALMDRHAGALFRYLARALQDESDAADLAQETFARVYQHRRQFDPRRKFTTWLYAIAGNFVRDRYRWRARHPKISLDTEPGGSASRLKDTLPAADPGPDQTLQAAERAAAVRQAIAALPEDLRQPLILATYQDLSQADIAAILHCSVKAVETRLYRARRRLRGRLAKWLL
jgi:RNA polymerase sigma-70 factor (ECF subfamily)